MSLPGQDDGTDDPMTTPTLVDLALGQGQPAALDALRAKLAKDPLAALDFAETRQMLERLRGVAVAPSQGFAGRLEALARQAERRQVQRQPTGIGWGGLTAVAAVAAALFVLLTVLDPLGLRRPTASEALTAEAADRPSPAGVEVVARTESPMLANMARALDATRRLAPGSRLCQAWDRFQAVAPADRLTQWLSSTNSVAVLRLDQELRSTADARLRVLRDRGQLMQVDGRVQALAQGLAAELGSDAELGVEDTALAVRALLASGEGDRAVLARGGERLVAMLPQLHGAGLATALAALGELAVATGDHMLPLREHGRRLVGEVVDVDDDNWSRRLPRLLATAAPAAIADAGRFLAIAPAFGVDGDEAMVVRLLLAASLQDRRDPANETPDLLVALEYGFRDVLTAADQTDIEARLRTWRLAGLMPDYRLVHQLAASRTPEQTGYARFQLELRRLGGVATPLGLRDRAALCLCLAVGYTPPRTFAPLAQG